MFHFFGTYTGDAGVPWLEMLAGFVGVLFAAGVSFAIFYLERLKEQKKEEERLDEIEGYVSISIPLLCDRIDSHLKTVKKVEDKLKKKETPDNFNFELTTSLHGRSLSWLSKTDLFTIYVTNKEHHRKDRIEYLSKLNNQLDYLENANELWVRMMDDTLRVNFNQYLNKYNDNFFELVSAIQRLIVTARATSTSFDAETLDLIKAMDGIMAGYQQTDNFKDHYVTVEKLFTPILEYCANLKKNRTALEIILMINKTTLWFENMHTLKASVLSVIKDTQKKMCLTKIELNRFLQLSKHESKKPWRRRKSKKKD